ncbi:MAG TPA: LLM class F420-dependent oxidoreductase [Acidimicrobiales bacterium]|nr:LLM class F420-dependent oxidoreductase [Acidimicrobiales bacterium]
MKLGIMYANAGPLSHPEVGGALARLAEEAGIESLWTVEHVVVPAGYESTYPYSADGRMPGGEDVDIADPLVWLAWVGARTSRIRLATGILILPQRQPLVLAKEVATLDRLTGGRVTLGVGIGWLREEFDALGVPFEERAGRTEEHIQALRAAWTQDEPTFEGRFVSFRGAKSYPKPAQPGGVPIVVGGHSEGAARRAGRFGDGFFPGSQGVEATAHLIDVMRKAAEEAGRDPDGIEITCGGRPDPATVERYAELGVSRFMVPPPGFDPATLEEQLPRLVAALG